MAKPKILVDLSLGHRSKGFSGIPQDSRLLFAGLATSEALDVTGMLWSTGMSWHGEKLNTIEAQSVFLGFHLRQPQFSLSARLLSMLNRKVGSLYERVVASRTERFGLHRLSDAALKDIIWRQIFASTVVPEERSLVLEQNFALSNLGLWAAIDTPIIGCASARLDTTGYDAVVFHDSRNVIPSPETKKFIRYHDGLPVIASDTFQVAPQVRGHIRSVRASAANATFVCNSTSAKQDLVHLYPPAAERAVVIPYFVPKVQRAETTANSLLEMASMRVSSSTLDNKSKPVETARKWFGAEKDAPPRIPEFILSLATIEPRKNYQGLIRAWTRLRHQRQDDIRLVIIGKPGWEFEEILADMRPYVGSGTLLHLQDVPQDELKFWYSGAKCFAFPSFAEGFGLPPIEAMQCGTPVMVSDIPAHRYSAGDAAVFCDPYDPADMAEKLDVLLGNQGADYVTRGYRNAERFTRSAVLPAWEELFTTGMLRQ